MFQVSIANVFHALISKRPYKNELDLYQTLKIMQKDMYGSMNPDYLFIFIRNIEQNLIGSQVLLNNGSIGEIIMPNQYDLLSPLVKTEDNYYDLSKQHDILIEKVIS